MVDSNTNGNERDPSQKPDDLAADLDMTDESLDQFLAEVDPDFSNSLKTISDDKTLTLADIQITASDQELSDERDQWAHSKRLSRLIFRISPYMVPRISLRLKKIIYKAKSGSISVIIRSKNFLFDFAMNSKKLLQNGVKNSKENIWQRRMKFRDRSLRWSNAQRITFYFTNVLILLTIGFIYLALTKGIIPKFEKEFISSWSEEDVPVMEYEVADQEPFYDNLRSGQNLLLIQKMVVNIKKSPHSLNNPMVASEFFLEGNNPDVIIEVKDRESEIRDLMQRLIEEFNFDQLDSAEGKKMLVDTVKREVNRVLTTGALRRVLIKTMILKP